MTKTSQRNGSPSQHHNGGPSPLRVTGATSLAVVHLLSDQGVPANEVVVTRAERHGSGNAACWSVSVLRGREIGSHSFRMELVEKVLASGPDKEWYSEVGQLLEAVGMGFPT